MDSRTNQQALVLVTTTDVATRLLIHYLDEQRERGVSVQTSRDL